MVYFLLFLVVTYTWDEKIKLSITIFDDFGLIIIIFYLLKTMIIIRLILFINIFINVLYKNCNFKLNLNQFSVF